MTARERMVRVVAEALRETGLVTYYDVMAEAVVAAMEAEMGLRTEVRASWLLHFATNDITTDHAQRLVTDWQEGEG